MKKSTGGSKKSLVLFKIKVSNFNFTKKKIVIFLLFAFIFSLVPAKQSKAEELSTKLKGRILLQVESKGEAWYVNPKDGKRYYMANGSEAYVVMRKLGVGITNSDLEKIKNNLSTAKKQQGKIFLQVENHGEAFYIDINGGVHYLKDGDVAYQIMRKLGLGIKNNDLAKIVVAEKDKTQGSDMVFYQVSDVVDGDTIKISINGEVTTLRLIGMDTPETVDPRKPVQCFGQEASKKGKELLLGQKIRIEKDATQGDVDKYGRQLVYIYRDDGLFYNKYMIEQGYAHEYTYDIPYKYQAEFKIAQKSAQENLRGLWSPSTCNGDTTEEAVSSVGEQNSTAGNSSSTGKYYTSSYKTSEYYYPEACSGWRGLTESYLKVFDSLEALLKIYPSRVISPSC